MSDAEPSVESLLDDFEAAIKEAAYSDCSPMGDPGNYYKHMERDEARKALLAALAVSQSASKRAEYWKAEHHAATALPYDEKSLHHPDSGTGWKCYVCNYSGTANNFANRFCANCQCSR